MSILESYTGNSKQTMSTNTLNFFGDDEAYLALHRAGEEKFKKFNVARNKQRKNIQDTSTGWGWEELSKLPNKRDVRMSEIYTKVKKAGPLFLMKYPRYFSFRTGNYNPTSDISDTLLEMLQDPGMQEGMISFIQSYKYHTKDYLGFEPESIFFDKYGFDTTNCFDRMNNKTKETLVDIFGTDAHRSDLKYMVEDFFLERRHSKKMGSNYLIETTRMTPINIRIMKNVFSKLTIEKFNEIFDKWYYGTKKNSIYSSDRLPPGTDMFKNLNEFSYEIMEPEDRTRLFASRKQILREKYLSAKAETDHLSKLLEEL